MHSKACHNKTSNIPPVHMLEEINIGWKSIHNDLLCLWRLIIKRHDAYDWQYSIAHTQSTSSEYAEMKKRASQFEINDYYFR